MDTSMQNLILGLVGAVGGGFSVGWIAKMFFGNYIKNNDEKHKTALDEQKEISAKISQVRTDIAVINTKLDLMSGVNDKVIVLEHSLRTQNKDINAAHEKLRDVV